MSAMHWVLLPGLDGTGRLFEGFLRYVSQEQVTVVAITRALREVVDGRTSCCSVARENADRQSPHGNGATWSLAERDRLASMRRASYSYDVRFNPTPP